MRFLTKSFLQGLLVVVPLAITVYVTWRVTVEIDGLLGLDGTFGPGLVIVLAGVTAVGAITTNVIGRKLLALFEWLLNRVPLVKLLYKALKDMIGAFVGDEKSFDKPVMVTLFPGGAAKALGFVTRESLELPGAEGHVAVYLPQSYNFAGNLLLFPREHVRPVDTDPSDFMALVVSGGVSA